MSAPRAATAITPGTCQRGIYTVVGIVFLDLVGFGIIIPILPFYVRSFGVSDVFIGLLAASYSLMQFVFAPTLGRLSDGHGRKPVLVLSLAGNAVAWTLFGLGTEFDVLFGVWGAILALFASRMLAGAMGGNIATAQAYVADVTPPEERAGALGLVGASFGLGFVFGPAIGGVAAGDAVVSAADAILPAFVPATPYSIPSFAAATLSLLACGCAVAFLHEPERAGTINRQTIVEQFVAAFRDDTLRALVGSFLVVSVAFSGIQVMFIPFVADTYGFDETAAALLLTYIGLLGVLNQGVVVGRLAKRVDTSTIALAGASLLVVALGTLPFSPALGRAFLPAFGGVLTHELVVLLAVLAVLSAGFGWLNVALSTLVSTSAPPDRQGSTFGVTQGAGSLGRAVGPPIMATLYVAAYWSPFVAGALLVLPIVGVLLGVRRRTADRP